MSTEVECSQLDSGLTAASSSGAQDENQNKSEEVQLQKEGREQEEQGQKGSENQLADGHSSEEAQNPADVCKECNENDKENDQSSNADSTVEAVKRKVVEAPPPKVNPWTRRTTGRVPVNNINSSSQEKGEVLLFIT